ncbi:TetR/AcrR family transcriptional regulator [Halocella sp. SP3-1]|nr:TetR/AcrR family transcriptional regulator [Halocella sp. SP3-1]
MRTEVITIETYTRKSREERLEEIKQAAQKVFLRKGFKDTNMEDIINETTLSKGGFYYYFKNTKEIYFAILEEKSDNTIAYLGQMFADNQDTIGEVVDYLAESIFEDFAERRLFLMGLYESYYDNDFMEKFRLIQEKYVDLTVNIIIEKHPDMGKEKLREKINFLYTLYHAFVINCNMMAGKNIYKRNKKYLKDLFIDILRD